MTTGPTTEARWAFLDTETGEWIEVKPGTVHGPDVWLAMTARLAAAEAVVEATTAWLYSPSKTRMGAMTRLRSRLLAYDDVTK